jgi:hypothetical protein
MIWFDYQEESSVTVFERLKKLDCHFDYEKYSGLGLSAHPIFRLVAKYALSYQDFWKEDSDIEVIWSDEIIKARSKASKKGTAKSRAKKQNVRQSTTVEEYGLNSSEFSDQTNAMISQAMKKYGYIS